MSQTWPRGHRYSFPQHQQGYDYSTPNSGDDGRHASLGHIQYQNSTSPSSYYAELEQGRSHNQFQGHSQTWQNDFSPSQYSAQSQRSPVNNVDPHDIQSYVRPVHQDPWTGAVVGGTFDARQQESLQLWKSSFQGPRAHTITDCGFSPVFQRPQPITLTRTSVPSLIDSGIVPSNTGSQDVSKYPHSIYDYDPREPPAFNSTLQPPAESVKSEPQTKRRKKSEPSVCPIWKCGKELKNPSEVRKHHLQHQKPFACEVRSCSRRGGFATKNDLQRHRKSVHGARPSVGKQTGYICQACSIASPNAIPKWWPRLDNFKAHIDRKHKDRDKDQLVKLSEAPRPERAITESGYGSQPAGSVLSDGQLYQHDLMSPMEESMSRQYSNQDDMALFGASDAPFDTLAGVGQGTFVDPFSTTRATESREYGSGGMTDRLSVLHDAAQLQLGSPVDSILTSPAIYHTRVPSIRIDEAGFNDSLPTFTRSQWGRQPGKRVKNEWSAKSANASNSQDNLDANRTESGEYACPNCPKTKRRSCDLRKHMKRHARPYGCTFPNCYKRFGSRNDWKRHENSQHFLQEMWRCGLTTIDGKICGRLIHQQPAFVNHLQKRHNLDSTSLETHKYVKTMHLGREGHKNFWCGFCNTLIPQPESNQQDSIQTSAWVLRSKHIGDHFDKENLHINDWVCIEHNKKKSLITVQDKKKAKTRFRDGKAADDSDLPDDGIPHKQDPQDSPTFVPDEFEEKISIDMSMAASSKRKFEDVDDVDADGVSDCD